MLNASDSKIKRLLAAWHENEVKTNRVGTADPQKFYDQFHQKSAKDRKKFIALDMGGSGHFLVDRLTEQVYSIKGYGVPNLKKPRGTVDFLTQFIKAETEAGREYMHTWWYDLHPTE